MSFLIHLFFTCLVLVKAHLLKKKRAKKLGSECRNCVRLSCKREICKYLGMVSDNREDKIKFVKDDLSKESLDNILGSLKTHQSGHVQYEIHRLWRQERAQCNLENLTQKDHVCQFIRKLDGKPILDP